MQRVSRRNLTARARRNPVVTFLYTDGRGEVVETSSEYEAAAETVNYANRSYWELTPNYQQEKEISVDNPRRHHRKR